jgi:hypothetical protein
LPLCRLNLKPFASSSGIISFSIVLLMCPL